MNKTSFLLLTAPIILTLVALAIPLHAFGQAVCGTGGTGGIGGLGGTAGKGGMKVMGLLVIPGQDKWCEWTNLNGTGIWRHLSWMWNKRPLNVDRCSVEVTVKCSEVNAERRSVS